MVQYLSRGWRNRILGPTLQRWHAKEFGVKLVLHRPVELAPFWGR